MTVVMQLSKDADDWNACLARLVGAAAAVVEGERQSCIAQLPTLEKHVQAAAAREHGHAEAWRHLANPSVLELERAMNACADWRPSGATDPNAPLGGW